MASVANVVPVQRPLYCCTITLTTAPQNLLAIVQALGGRFALCNASGQGYSLQADPSNTPNILIGDEGLTVSPQNCGLNLPAGATAGQQSQIPYTAPFGSLWGAAKSSTALLNITILK